MPESLGALYALAAEVGAAEVGSSSLLSSLVAAAASYAISASLGNKS
jgi:hypothetical protein